MRKAKFEKGSPVNRCVDCRGNKKLSRSYYCEECRDKLLKRKLREG